MDRTVSERIYFVYEVIMYWKNDKKEIKSFYKIGHSSSDNGKMCLSMRFDNDIYRGAKIFVINLIQFDSRKRAKYYEEILHEKALKINNSEFIAKYDEDLGLAADFGDYHEYPHYFGGSTEVLRTPKMFEDLIKKLDDYFDKNPNIYYPKKLNKHLEEDLVINNKAQHRLSANSGQSG